VVGDINDQEVQAAATRRLSNARWVRFARDGFSYQARAVMVHTPTDGTDSAPPNFHKLIFVIELHNLQNDRPAPLPLGTTLTSETINIPKRLVSDADGTCSYPFSGVWANATDRCALFLQLANQGSTYQASQVSIPADRNVLVAMATDGDVPDSVADSEVRLSLRNETGTRIGDVSDVDVPLI
jgi:hypothetical protein